ncbi:hypothetical protein HCN44_005026 [Aphidius gifuensis]|uniref:Uncharacterized protein n=1 Tax=Aphidius gifuensis TaxID=684658 RepID=A0A834XUE1_APHGI|nr:hypothetical protein HCN44_005026 [Aphidius gifuensis]
MDVANGQKPHGGQLSTGGGTGLDKNNDWQMELLMEKLRSKSSAFKSLVETAKNLRMAMLDKRFSIDSVEKGQLQKCLDTEIARQLNSLQSMAKSSTGLKFMMASSELCFYIIRGTI